MKIKRLVLAALFLLLFLTNSSADWVKRPELRWRHLYHYDMRQANHELYTQRLSAKFTYQNQDQKAVFRVEPFFEARRNIDKGIWQRKEFGIEIGKDIFPWVYFGQAIQRVRMKEDYQCYGDFKKRDSTESETRLLFSHNLISNKYINLKGFVLDEYIYDFRQGAGIRNDLVIGAIMPWGKNIETMINWRHIDRIHYYDSDTVEVSLTLLF